jgi:hypothetical protein
LAFAAWSICCWASTGALALPEGRHYEMVSPVYKQGYGVAGIRAVGPQGESVDFQSKGGFDGPLSGGYYGYHDYLARRTSSEWSTESVGPAFGALTDFSANLQYMLASGPLGPNAGVESNSITQEVFQLHPTDVPNSVASWEVFGGEAMVIERVDKGLLSASEVGASADLCHVVIGATAGALLAAAQGTIGQVYDLARGCGREPPSLRLVGVNNAGAPINPICPVELGTGSYAVFAPPKGEQEASVNALDAHGEEIFFTTNLQEAGSSCSERDLQLFVRLGGSRTVEVSRPLEPGPAAGCVASKVSGEVPCDGALKRASAFFKGASKDGSRVFFSTTAPLTGEDTDTGNDLYMATIGCPGTEPSQAQPCEPSQREVTSLAQVSHDPVAGQAAEVQGVVRVAPDGSRIYFVARGVLSEGANAQGREPVKGADNLYAYDTSTHKSAFVAELCSGPGLSGGSLREGAVEDVRCPRSLTEGGADAQLLWRSSLPQAQSTPDGAFLVFDTYAQLLPSDTDSSRDVYRYNALTGALDRVSVSEDFFGSNGNGPFDASIAHGLIGNGLALVYEGNETATRAISANGSRIVFDTAEPLSPDAKNHDAKHYRTNIYEWHEGSAALISSGTSPEDDTEATITASGRDIFFIGAQGLVAQDTDGAPDLYDARMEEGFPPTPAPREQCSGDACYGPLSNPAPLLVPGSVVQAPGGNLAQTAPKLAVKAKKVKPKKKVKRKVRAKGRTSHRAGKASGLGRSGR